VAGPDNREDINSLPNGLGSSLQAGNPVNSFESFDGGVAVRTLYDRAGYGMDFIGVDTQEWLKHGQSLGDPRTLIE